MGSPIVTPLLARSCNSDIALELLMNTPWDMANSNAEDWASRAVLSKIEGMITIRGEPAPREILVLGAELAAIPELSDEVGYHILAVGKSDPTGHFTLQWDIYSGDIIAIYMDDLGGQWQPNTIYAEKSLVYPREWNGLQYECISAGTTGVTEPVWWFDDGATGFSGTAAFKARQYLPAQADGPITPYQWEE